MDLLDKVRLIIGHKCESPSQFADEINIPRSAVSHLLSGRNKPSLEVIRKIITRYPELGKDWIWDDDKLPNLAIGVPDSGSPVKNVENTPKKFSGMTLDLFEQPAEKLRETPKLTPKRIIDRILIFYSDGTFEEFKPNRL